MRKSNYVGTTNGPWTCIHCGIDYLQPAYRKKRDSDGKRVRSISAGRQQYFYIYERPTSDGIAFKQTRLNAYEALQVKRGRRTVEEIANKKRSMNSEEYENNVSYRFCD
jgi:hypothetical protein